MCADGGCCRRARPHAVDVVNAETREVCGGEESALCDGAQRTARGGVTEVRRIGRSTAAEAVEHDEKYAFDSTFLHNRHLSYSSSPARLRA